MIVLVSKIVKSLVIFLFLTLSFNPICYAYSYPPLPMEIRIIDVSYPPNIRVNQHDNISESNTNFEFTLSYNIKNPNTEVVSISMANCYNIPFAHVNATFEDEEFYIFYGYAWIAMPCDIPFEPGLDENRTVLLDFSVYPYQNETLPVGFYTIWIDLNYTSVYFPTISSYAYMNVTEEDVEIDIEWGNNSNIYPREVNWSFISMILPIVILSTIMLLQRTRNNRKLRKKKLN